MIKTNYGLKENLIVKEKIPKIGIICSNPKRAYRIASQSLNSLTLLTEYQSAWAIDIYVGSYRGKQVFIAAVAVGASGAAFSIQQLVSAGAKYIVRYGSNDVPDLTVKDMHNVVLVDSADNLYGLMHGNGSPKSEWGSLINASSELIRELKQTFEKSNIDFKLAICHHVEDYAAYAYPSLSAYKEQVMQDIQKLELNDAAKLHCRDMESAALFYRAKLDGFYAATVLQNIPKHAGFHQAYDKKTGEIAKQLEPKIASLILDTLVQYGEIYQDNFRSYIKLNEHNIIDYLFSIKIFVKPTSNIIEIGDGNLNQVFRVEDGENSFIIKQALPYLRCVGESFALDKMRIRYEIAYLKKVATICPQQIPKIFYTDDIQMMTMHMQDLKQCDIIRDGLLATRQYPKFANQIAKYLAAVLFKTSRLYLNLDEHSKLIMQFNDNKLRSLTENLIFTFPFIEQETNFINKPELFNFKFRQNATTLLSVFSNNTEALVHGDLHTGSIFANQTETYVIDGEFAFMGPGSFDLGILTANLITSYINHTVYNNSSMQSWLLSTIETIHSCFECEFIELWNQSNAKLLKNTEEVNQYQRNYLNYLLAHSIGFAGLEICRRVCGVAGVKEIREINDTNLRISAQNLALNIGTFMVENYLNIDKIHKIAAKLKNNEFKT